MPFHIVIMKRNVLALVAVLVTALGSASLAQTAQDAVTLFFRGDWLGCLRSADAVLAEQPENGLALACRSRVLAYLNDNENGWRATADALQACAKDPVGLGLTMSFLGTGRDSSTEALEEFKLETATKILELVPESRTGPQSYAKSSALLALGKKEEALKEAQRGVSLSTDSPTLRARLGFCFQALNRLKEAEAAYRSAVKINQAFSVPRVNLGRILLAQGAKEQARLELEAVVKECPDTADAHLALGDLSFDEGRFETAVEEYGRALAANPRTADAYYNRALALARLSRIQEALKDLERFRDNVPLQAQAESFRLSGDYSLTLNDWNTSEAHYQSFERLSPKATSHLLNKGITGVSSGDPSKGVEILRKAASLAPQAGTPHFYIGFGLERLGDYPGAVEAYDKAQNLSVESPALYFNRGLILLQEMHRLDRAVADFAKAVQLDPNYLEAYFMLADSYDSQGQQALADQTREAGKRRARELGKELPKRKSVLFPGVPFDKEAASSALSSGGSTVLGKAVSKKGSRSFAADGVQVSLYPATPYFEAWYRLREAREDADTVVLVCREAEKFKVTSRVDQNGDFVFRNLKPGRYFAQAYFEFTQVKKSKVYVGTDSYRDGPYMVTTNHYEDRVRYIDHSDRLEGFVEIQKDGDTVKLSLKDHK